MSIQEEIDRSIATMDAIADAVRRGTLRVAHPAPDLDAPPPAGDDRPIARGFILLEHGTWLRLDAIDRVTFNTGPGIDACSVSLRCGETWHVEDDDARAFWVAWTRYLAGDD